MLGLDYEIVDACDYQQMSQEELAELTDQAAAIQNPLITKGVQACALSHLKAYKQIISEGHEVALIVEDDAILSNNIKGLLNEIENRIGIAEVVSLWYASHTPDKLKLSTQHQEKLPGETILAFPIDISQVNSTQAYVITREAAARILEKALPIRAAADYWGVFYNFGGFDSFRCIYPTQASPALFESTIDYQAMGSLRVKIGTFIRRHKIPLLYTIIKNKNKRLLNEKAPDFVDQPPFNQRIG